MLGKILAFLFVYGWQILGALGFLIWAGYEIVTHGIDKFAQGAMLRLQKWAEKQADVKGDELMEMAVQLTMCHFVKKLPLGLRKLVTEEFVRARLHWLYNATRDFLDDGKLNGSWVQIQP